MKNRAAIKIDLDEWGRCRCKEELLAFLLGSMPLPIDEGLFQIDPSIDDQLN
jgi:hypothetical protein